jgi:hypothetical protein
VFLHSLDPNQTLPSIRWSRSTNRDVPIIRDLRSTSPDGLRFPRARCLGFSFLILYGEVEQ